MEIEVKRFSDNKDASLGVLFIDGVFQCFTLEDEERFVKKMGETRIPEGTYEVKLRKEGGHHERYKVKYSDIHKGMLHIVDVPNFKWILIHIGNTEKDTDGCLLVGDIIYSNHTLGGSTIAYKKIYPKIAAELEKNNKVTIKFSKV